MDPTRGQCGTDQWEGLHPPLVAGGWLVGVIFVGAAALYLPSAISISGSHNGSHAGPIRYRPMGRALSSFGWGRIFVGAGPLPSQEYHYGPTQWVPQGANGNDSIVPWLGVGFVGVVFFLPPQRNDFGPNIMAGPMRYGPMERAPSSFWWLGEDSRAGRFPTWISPTAD
ncbi:hypothetical protein B296_00040409, partial [Ensete ventricosum]